jgi:hypothetical protein
MEFFIVYIQTSKFHRTAKKRHYFVTESLLKFQFQFLVTIFDVSL